MIDIEIIRKTPELVKENIKKKFQDKKLPLVDEILSLDEKVRKLKIEGDTLRQQRNTISSEIGTLMREGKKDVAEENKKKVVEINNKLIDIEKEEEELSIKLKDDMMKIPNIIDPSVPIGKDDSENVEVQKFGDPVVPNYEIPYHADIMTKVGGLDKDSAGRTSGNGFYYLMGDIARLSSAMLSYARDYMIDKKFIYCIPPFMIRSDVVTGVMSFDEMDAMMYKIEGEDLYLIGTSEHSMIGKFIDNVLDKKDLPYTLTSYSPCFRKEAGSARAEERGMIRGHQFNKIEMVQYAHPDHSKEAFEELVEKASRLVEQLGLHFRVSKLAAGDCSASMARTYDVELWIPSMGIYKECSSVSNANDYQARRNNTRFRDGETGKPRFVHTLNGSGLATSRLIPAIVEQFQNADGSVTIPEVLRKYMGGMEKITK